MDDTGVVKTYAMLESSVLYGKIQLGQENKEEQNTMSGSLF